MKESFEESIFGSPIIALWHKIDTLNKENHHLVDWKAPKEATESATNYRRRWSTRITAQELLTGSRMNQRGKWPLEECARVCGYQS